MIDRSLNFGRHIIEYYLRYIPMYDSVLDVGVGTGADLMAAKSINPAATLYAIDINPSCVNALKTSDINTFNIDIERDVFPFENESIDIVIMNQVLEHTKEIFWILHEVSRILKVNGYIIIGVPNLASLHNRLLLLLGKQPSSMINYSAHVRGFTKVDMLNLFNICAPDCYHMKLFKGSNFYPFSYNIANILARLFPNLAWGIFFMMQKQYKYNNEILEYLYKANLESNFYQGVVICPPSLQI